MISVVRVACIFKFKLNSSTKLFRTYKINEKRSLDIRLSYNCFICKNFHASNVLSKKRRTEDEKLAEKSGIKRIIKFSPKARPKTDVIEIWKNMTVLEVAKALNKDIDHVLEAMVFVNDSRSYNKKNSIIDNPQVIKDIVKVSGYRFKIIPPPDDEDAAVEINKDAVRSPPAPIENLKSRPPVVTVMGHVDHGKTTLLDSLRNTNVVDQEFGGITQHIGAFSVQLSNGDLVTFLDTPGHAAFTSMRARGANVTDMVVLVVAADDGVMEQTIESIRMAIEAKVPIIVAINKIDKPNANIEGTKKMLAQHGIVVEDLGGDIQAVPISALKSTNLDTLVEAIALQSQLMELKADPTGLVEGVVIEAQTDPKRGKLATVIVQRGTLRKGCIVVAGSGWARTRIMFSSDGTPISSATPSTPVQLLGWRELPSAGDEMIEVISEKRAAEVMRWRHDLQMQEKQSKDSIVIAQKEAIHRTQYEEMLQKKRLMGRYKIRAQGPREKMFVESNEPSLNIVFKGDVDGSVEAILDVLETYDDHQNCKLDIVHYGIGNISESDIEMADAFNAVIYAFNVNTLPQISEMVKKNNINIRKFNVIYKMIDDIKEELNLRIPVSQEEELLGEANVLQNFAVNEKRKTANVAGCRCVKGVLKKNGLYRVLRNTDVIYEGTLESMRHLKNEVDSIKKGIECGLRMSDGSIEFKTGDTVVCYHMVDVRNTTKWDPGF